MHNMAPVDIQEPEGNETEICHEAADPSDYTYTRDPVSQTPRASTTEAVSSDSQMILTGTPDPTHEVTTLQVQDTRGEEEDEIDVVSVEGAEPNNIGTTATVVNAISETGDETNPPLACTEPPNIHRH